MPVHFETVNNFWLKILKFGVDASYLSIIVFGRSVNIVESPQGIQLLKYS